jgi:hypothetical protein
MEPVGCRTIPTARRLLQITPGIGRYWVPSFIRAVNYSLISSLSGVITHSHSSRTRLTARTHRIAGSSNGTVAGPTAVSLRPPRYAVPCTPAITKLPARTRAAPFRRAGGHSRKDARTQGRQIGGSVTPMPFGHDGQSSRWSLSSHNKPSSVELAGPAHTWHSSRCIVRRCRRGCILPNSGRP